MTKKIKNVLVFVFALFAFGLASIFFVGCGINYDKIQLSVDTPTLELSVGESKEVTITIENFQKGFSNKVKVDNTAKSAFSVSEPQYRNNQIKLTITALAGGQGTVNVQTLEAGKQCSISVSVEGFSSSMSLASDMLYLSNKTDFVPTDSMFVFDSNTTNKDLLFFYIPKTTNVNFNTEKLVEVNLQENYASFEPVSGQGDRREQQILPFSSVSMQKNENNAIYLHNQASSTKIDFVNSFNMLAVYPHSMGEDKLVYCVSTVYVLPDLDVKISGGYIQNGEVKLSQIPAAGIKIVPNNKNLVQYLMRIEMNDFEADPDAFPIKLDVNISNDFVIADFCKDYSFPEDEGKNVRYIKISQNSIRAEKTELDFHIYYDLAQDTEDESVSVWRDYDIDILIAPTALRVNGFLDRVDLRLYDFYLAPEFGWQDLMIEVLSDFDTSASFDGIYFEYDTNMIDITFNGSPVANSNGNGRLYTAADLATAFKVRGKELAGKGNTEIVVHLVSDIIQQTEDSKEITFTINCQMIAGARDVSIDSNYENINFLLDVKAGSQAFNKQIYADAKFSFATITCRSANDFVDIKLNYENNNPYLTYDGNGNPYYYEDEGEDRFYLNLTVTPRYTSVQTSSDVSTYEIRLDNGMFVYVSFECINTLNLDTDSNPFVLTKTGNNNVTNVSYGKVNASSFYNEMNLELLNASTSTEVIPGSTANFEIVANTTSVNFEPNDSANVYVTDIGGVYRITTKGNGDTRVNFTLRGRSIEDFKAPQQDKTIFLYVNVSTYSLVEEFYFQNGSSYALNNTVYCNPSSSDENEISSLTFTPFVGSKQSKNFYQYSFLQDKFAQMFSSSTQMKDDDGNVYNEFEVTQDNFDEFISYDLVREEYFDAQANRDRTEFIHFFAKNSRGGLKAKTRLQAFVTNVNDPTDVTELNLYFYNGIIFSADDFNFSLDGQTYSVHFGNVYYIGNNIGYYDLNTFKYTNLIKSAGDTTVLTATLNQRKTTKEYNISITTMQYYPVERVSLISGQTTIDFSDELTSATLGVSAYPIFATNNKLKFEYVPTGNNIYCNALVTLPSTEGNDPNYDDSQSENGLFTLTFTCQDFLDNYGTLIDELNVPLTGKIYIYPTEWGESYSVINPDKKPIVIDVQFRNGTKANPKLLSKAQDVLNINKNERTLALHYFLRNSIDMGEVTGSNPIGILGEGENARLVGFSGSIVGTTSQAAITNVFVSNDNFTCKVGNATYSGLFAQINGAVINPTRPVEAARVENLTISGQFNVNLVGNVNYASLFTAINAGELVNVAAVLGGAASSEKTSSINASGTLYFGALAARNIGKIVQNFTAYQKDTEYENGKFAGQLPKQMSYFNQKLIINLNNATAGYVGGIVGATTNVLERVTDSSLKMYGYSSYSAFVDIKVTKTEGNVTDKVYVGGVAGAFVSPQSELVGGSAITPNNERNLLKNLLVGGEIDTLDVEVGIDSIGGIAGLARAYVSNITISQNVSRVFLRAGDYAGGILGEDARAGDGALVEFYESTSKEDNKVQAVDDGRNAFLSAMIITLYAKQIYSESDFDTKQDFQAYLNTVYAVGNSNNRNYVGDSENKISFEVVSYLNRTPLTPNGTIFPATGTSTTETYGDFLFASKAGNDAFVVNSAYFFVHQDVTLGKVESNFRMKTDDADAPDLFFMYYFSVSGLLNGNISGNTSVLLKDQIASLNFFASSSDLYPFKFESQEVTLSSSSSILNVDENGNFTTTGTGLVTITLSSILNVANKQSFYIYVLDYFNKDVTTSIFYTALDRTGKLQRTGSSVTVIGNSLRDVFMLPSYELGGTTQNGDVYNISGNGILSFNQVDYVLKESTDLTIKNDETKQQTHFSSLEIINQTATFKKNFGATNFEDDRYVLTPILQVTVKVDGKEVTYYYLLEKASIDLAVHYREAATAISTKNTFQSMKTNGDFSDVVTIESTNEKELLFYEIRNKHGNVIQSRMLEEIVGVREEVDTGTGKVATIIDYKRSNTTLHMTLEAYEAFLNENFTSDDLFMLTFRRRTKENNVFDMHCKINPESTDFLSRLRRDQDGNLVNDIYGRYTVTLYSSELAASLVQWDFDISLVEAELDYVTMRNFSNIRNVTAADEILVPSQYGMFEISLNPVEAVFEDITISNNMRNSQVGAKNASFVFLYQRRYYDEVSRSWQTEFVQAPLFGKTSNDSLTFTYQEMIDFLNSAKLADVNVIEYSGKIFVTYIMPSTGVEDGVQVQFDTLVEYGQKKSKTSSVTLTTKLENYARLVFDDKQTIDDKYLVANGLSYNLSLDCYGFDKDTVTISYDSTYVNVEQLGEGRYILNIPFNPNIPYNLVASGDPGFKVTITTHAEKVVDGKTVTSDVDLDVYIMEYVLNYQYSLGKFEDLVSGMENGVIRTAVGNPVGLKVDFEKFLEYDSTRARIRNKVQTFVDEMTSAIEWNAHIEDQTIRLREGLLVRDNQYFYANGLSVTPIRIYDAASDIYHFSAEGLFTIHNGEYTHTISQNNSKKLYTEFALSVYQQSTQDSPIPIYDYEDLLEMDDGAWYILLANIDLPSMETALANNLSQFNPITKQIAGLDGNGFSFNFAGTYDFADASTIGLFASVSADTILQNVTVQLTGHTTFRTNVSDFNLGLVAASNEGKITNCEAKVYDNRAYQLTVVSPNAGTSSYVAGLVAQNSGYITNSRAKVDILASVNLAGFVGQNSRIVASSAFFGASLNNRSNEPTVYTSGFAIVNSGKIYTSYASGVSGNKNTDADSMYYNAEEKYIQSSNNMSGFVYTNTGSVADCYSNVNLTRHNALTAGFVYENSGTVERCFSTSLLESGRTSSSGFAHSNTVTNSDGNDSITTAGGRIVDCYYLSDVVDGVPINRNINDNPNDADIHALTRQQFKISETNPYFKNYVVASGRDVNSVWFYNENTYASANFDGKYFNTSRLELVAANIVAKSVRKLDHTETIEDASGATATKYVYVFSDDCSALGSVDNPILIDNAQNFENYITNENSILNNNYAYYRLISDISYTEDEFLENNTTFKTKFRGYFEGNFMTISSQVLFSSESATFAGLFAEIGSSNDARAIGTVMNLTLAPTKVSFANANVVGALAGKLDGGNLFNIQINTSSSSNTVVEGYNIVGGIVGLAVGSYKMQNVNSQVGVRVRYQYQIHNDYTSSTSDYSHLSFGGGVAGILSGDGTFFGSSLSSVVSVAACKAGFMFGFVDQNVTVEKIDITMQTASSITPYSYGGFVAGESKGNLKNITVRGTGTNFTNIKKLPYVPQAFGGVAGIVSGGTVENVTMTQSINVSVQSDTTGINYLGGIAGMVTSRTNFKDIHVGTQTASVTLVGFKYVSGVAAYVEAVNNSILFDSLEVYCSLQVYGQDVELFAVGGVVGEVGYATYVEVTSSEPEVGNHIVVETVAYVFEHNQLINSFASAIIALNNSALSHSITYCQSSISGNISIENLGANGEMKSNRMYVEEVKNQQTDTTTYRLRYDLDFDVSEGQAAVSDVILQRPNPSTLSSTTVDLTFVTPIFRTVDAETGAINVDASLLYVNLYGSLFV